MSESIQYISPEKVLELLDEHWKWLDNIGGHRADLSLRNLIGFNFIRANLGPIELRDRSGDLKDPSWPANLSDANLRGANLDGASLQEANLKGADFLGARLTNADLFGVQIDDTIFDREEEQ